MKKFWRRLNDSAKLRTIIVILAFIGAYMFDRFWISKNVTFLSKMISLKFEFNIKDVINITIPSFGLIPVLLITMLFYFLTIIPYQQMRDKYEWKGVKQKILNALIGLLAIPICMLIGGILFLFLKWIFPETISSIAQAFVMITYFSTFDIELIKLNGSIASILGLIGGLYYLSKKS